MDRDVFILAVKRGQARIGLLQRQSMLVELARVSRAEQRVIEDRNLLDAAHGALEAEDFLLKFAPPAALRLVRQRIEASRDAFGGLHRLLWLAYNLGRYSYPDRRLLDHLTIVAAMQPIEHVADRARLLDQLSQILTGAMLA